MEIKKSIITANIIYTLIIHIVYDQKSTVQFRLFVEYLEKILTNPFGTTGP